MKKEKNTMTNLSLSNIRQNRSRSILTVISIVLTTLLLTVIASYGYPILQTTRRTFLYGMIFMLPAALLMDFHWYHQIESRQCRKSVRHVSRRLCGRRTGAAS